MAQRRTSLLSLPDELLDHIFDFLAEPLQGPHPLVPVLSVCRRVYKIAKPLFYRDVVLGGYLGATSHIEAAIQRDPSLGQLVSNLELRNYGSSHLASDRGDLSREQHATLRAFRRLTGLIVAVVEPDEAASTLAALPSTSLRSLDLQLIWTEEPSYWRDLQTRLSRFSELRTLICEDLELQTAIAENFPRRPRNSIQHLSLPSLLELHMTDYIFLEMFGGAGSLGQTLPRLEALHITMTDSDNTSALSACLSDSPDSLTNLVLSSADFRGAPCRWPPTLPALRHLELGPKTFAESEFLAYLPTAKTLESIEFRRDAEVTDRSLQALIGAARPPRLRQIRLDHVFGVHLEAISEELQWHGSARYRGDEPLQEFADRLRQGYGPHWPVSGSEEGLRLALADANANGIEVTGDALECIGWYAGFDCLLANHMAEQALDADRNDDAA